MSAVLIVGASARAAAWSAWRAGFDVFALDQFADTDLTQIATVDRLAPAYRDLIAKGRSLPPAAWMYTGGVENHPRLVETLSRERRLLGNAAPVLRQVRDPFLLRRHLVNAGFHYPPSATEPPPVTGRVWLRKPVRSCGGLHTSVWEPEQAARRHFPAGPFYFQECMDGQPMGALFVADGEDCSLLGVSELLHGSAWYAGHFQYAGSIFPTSAAIPTKELHRLGVHLTATFSLRGLFGVDVVFQNGKFWVLEVNPRYTASVELLERSQGVSLLPLHVAACLGRLPPPPTGRTPANFHGKAIVYAEQAVRIGSRCRQLICEQNARREWPQVADIPALATRVNTGSPIATVFAEAATREDLIAQLDQAARAIRSACDVAD